MKIVEIDKLSLLMYKIILQFSKNYSIFYDTMRAPTVFHRSQRRHAEIYRKGEVSNC